MQEVLGNGMTGALAFEAAANDIRLGKSKVALALGINWESAIPAVEHMMSSMRATGDVDFHAPFGFTPIFPGTPWMPPATSTNSIHLARN